MRSFNPIRNAKSNFSPLIFSLCGALLYALAQQSATAQSNDWCIRMSPDGSKCEIERSAERVLTYELPDGYSLTFSNTWDGNQEVKILHNQAELTRFTAGMLDVPAHTIQIPLTQPYNLNGVLTIRTDGVFEIGDGANRSFYIPANGGIMLIPLGSHYLTLWLLGGNLTRTFEELSDKVQDRIERIELYLGIDQSTARPQSNYFREVPINISLTGARMSLSSSETPACCCNGTGKKTKIRGVGGRGSEDGSQLQAAFDALPDRDKECIEFETFPYDPDMCAKDIAIGLAGDNMVDHLSGDYCKVVTAAHSQGGIPAGYAANIFQGVETHTHTMGSPLQGAYVGGAVPMGVLWGIGYFFPIPGSSFVMDLASDCMFSEAASSHQYPPIGSGSTFVTHTHEPTGMFPLSTQQGGPAGSTSQHHPGTDHNSIVDSALQTISSEESCTTCGNGKIEPGEECDGVNTICCNDGGCRRRTLCTADCKCAGPPVDPISTSVDGSASD